MLKKNRQHQDLQGHLALLIHQWFQSLTITPPLSPLPLIHIHIHIHIQPHTYYLERGKSGKKGDREYSTQAHNLAHKLQFYKRTFALTLKL